MNIFKTILNPSKIREFITSPRFLVILILIGIIFRIVTIFTDVPRFDGAFYSTIGYGVATQHDFVTLGDVHTYSFSLTYPAYLAIFYAILGFSIPVTQLASIIVSIVVLGLAYITTANIMGKEKALLVTAVLALLPSLITSTGKNYIENMVLIFFIPTIWAILKSFKDSRYIILASFLAGLVYYTKTDIGFPVVIGGIAVYAIWRFYHIRLALFKDKNYYIAFLILLVMGLIRAYLINTAEVEITTATEETWSHLSSFEGIFKFVVQAIFHAILIGGFLIFWVPELRHSIFSIKKEKGILLLSALALMIPIIIHASSFPLFSTETIERVSRPYITIVYVPFLWSFLTNKNLEKISLKTNKLIARISNLLVNLLRDRKKLLILIIGLFLAGVSALIDDYLPILYLFGALALIIEPLRKRVILLLIAFLILSVNSLTQQYRPAYIDCADEINKSVEKGDVIALARIEGNTDLPADRIYPFIAEREISFEVYNHSNISGARFIISDSNVTFNGYNFIGIYRGEVKPSILKSIAMAFMGKSDRYQEFPLYLWERI